ncbi:MAG: glycosyltransferase family 10 domain-containing protein [Cyanobacteriota bacterium]
MRVLGVISVVERVSRWTRHDLLIRGPFSDGNQRRKATNYIFTQQQQLLRRGNTVRLHVSSENPFASNYQSFDESNCNFGLGHELRQGDTTYLRLPHWANYCDFEQQGVPSPRHWVRLGKPIQCDKLLRPLDWNFNGHHRAAFIASYLNGQRRFLMSRAALVLPIDGYGKAFDRQIEDHSKSSFTKEDLLKSYRFNFCPENSIAPGYVTEKIPESFACGAIPIGYVDPHANLDFNKEAFVNLYDYLGVGIEAGLTEELNSKARQEALTSTPLLKKEFPIEEVITFLRKVVDLASHV